MSTLPLTRRPEWRALAEHHGRIRDVHLRELFARDPGRGDRMVAEAAGLYLDYSKHDGSDLGPAVAYEVLRAYSRRDLTFRFVSNVDGTDFQGTRLIPCDVLVFCRTQNYRGRKA